MQDQFAPTPKTSLRQKPMKGFFDRSTVFAILDASMVCNVGCVVNGEPLVTPLLCWRDRDTLYWHGAKRGRAIGLHAAGRRVCVSVSLLDGVNFGRSGIATSIRYRSVMIFGTTAVVTDDNEKRKAMARLVNRTWPGRAAMQRPIHQEELDRIDVISLPLIEVSAKVTDTGPREVSDADYENPIWAGTFPVRLTVGSPIRESALRPGIELPEEVASAYTFGAAFEDALRQVALANEQM